MSQIEVCTPSEAEAYLRQFAGEPPRDITLRGEIEAVCREEGEIVWKLAQKNLVTDQLRRYGTRTALSISSTSYSCRIFTHPSSDPARYDRSDLADVTGHWQISASIAPGWDGTTLTRSYTTSFGIPNTFTRRLGVVGLSDSSYGYDDTFGGATRIFAYTVLNPYKQQGPNQTLEITYRLTLVPIY